MYIDIHTHGQQPPAGKQVRIVNLPFPPPSPEPPDYYSTGIHPWDAQAGCDSRLRQIEECLSSSPRIIAIGETGLDALKGPEKNIQQQCFVRHIALSEKYHKPLIIHCVKAFPELTALRKKHKPRLSWILHGFASRQSIALQLAEAGFFLSFGPALLYRPALQDILQHLPPHRLFFETDAHPSCTIEEIYHTAAEILHLSQEQLQQQVEENFRQAFGITPLITTL